MYSSMLRPPMVYITALLVYLRFMQMIKAQIHVRYSCILSIHTCFSAKCSSNTNIGSCLCMDTCTCECIFFTYLNPTRCGEANVSGALSKFPNIVNNVAQYFDIPKKLMGVILEIVNSLRLEKLT